MACSQSGRTLNVMIERCLSANKKSFLLVNVVAFFKYKSGGRISKAQNTCHEQWPASCQLFFGGGGFGRTGAHTNGIPTWAAVFRSRPNVGSITKWEHFPVTARLLSLPGEVRDTTEASVSLSYGLHQTAEDRRRRKPLRDLEKRQSTHLLEDEWNCKEWHLSLSGWVSRGR